MPASSFPNSNSLDININIGANQLGDIQPCGELNCEPLVLVIKLLYTVYLKKTNTNTTFTVFYSTPRGKRMVNRLTDTIWREAPIYITHGTNLNLSNVINN